MVADTVILWSEGSYWILALR